MKTLLICLGISSMFCIGCSAYKESPKYNFNDEFYTFKSREKRYPIYVHNAGDTIKLFAIAQSDKIYKIDTSKYKAGILPAFVVNKQAAESFQKNSFDIDFITIICKYRPSSQGFPNQFNTNLNGAVYAGCRKDIYAIKYKAGKLGFYKRSITHYGFSLGAFAGAGGTAVNEWTTIPSLNKEYDGVVFTKGIAAIIGIDKINFGLALGWDNLLDKYKQNWIYQNKPWLGITLGLNIN